MQTSKRKALHHETNEAENRQLGKELKHQGDKVISNAFARFYYARLQQRFDLWKLQVEQQKEKERIIRRLLERQRRYAAFFLFHTLKEWMEKERIRRQNEISADLSKEMETIKLNSNFDEQ